MPSTSQINDLYGPRTKDIHDQINAIAGGYTNSVAGLANQGLVLKIASVAQIASPVTFVAFMESYNETFSQNFQQDQVFGRMDPIQSFQNTQRKLSVSWKLLSANEREAEFNMFSISRLTTLMYPVYTGSDVKHVKRAPVMAIRYMNLIRDPNQGNGNYLFGTIGNLSITPDLEFGVFTGSPTSSEGRRQRAALTVIEGGEIYPKIFTLSLDFNPIHYGTLGQVEMKNDHLYPSGFAPNNDGSFFKDEQGIPEDPLGGKPRSDTSPVAATPEQYQQYQRAQLNTILSAQNDEIARIERPWERVSQKYKEFFKDSKE
ncbi:MAG: hypothetical protein ACXADH_01730 [Candidatus Kariarchaeaceae archaeon]|jgi:hypothetical protein